AFRQQRRLLAIHPLNETPHQFPPRFSKRIIASTEFLHSLGQKAECRNCLLRSASSLEAEIPHILKCDEIRMNHHRALGLLFEHDLFGKPLRAFPDHALGHAPAAFTPTPAPSDALNP
ncbi:hypothetical protein QCM77_33090, partial [Bradyrhizobium sp. SSUT18]|uniref:hypothetical protein n=1 Tax=Bradyrhizobium sp. SSUT18 TaxID=3040602 RepID=UPI00244C33D3